MPRTLFSSNAPWSCTGYAQQTKFIVRGIRDMGYPVAIHAWWGLEGGPTTWEGIDVFPRYLDVYGNDAMPHLCRKWKADLLITLIDLWVMDPALGHMGNTRWCPYHPIDHDPIPADVAARFDHAHRLLLYSQSAVDLVKKHEGGRHAGKIRYLPHGIDCETLKPASSAEERIGFRKKYFPDWPEDAFICAMVAANKGYPSRKSFPETLEAFARFASHHPEARLYLHSYAGSEFKGPNLQELVRSFGIAERTRIANGTMIVGGEYEDEMMREIYCSMDVLLSPSQGEGCGLPILESQACGTPVIVTDFSAMSENVGLGWRVPPLRLQPTLLLANQALADVGGIVHAMEECYRRPKSPYWGQIARDFALGYNWPKIISDYWAPFLREMDHGRRELAMELEELRAQ